MQDGACWELVTLGHHTNELGCGYMATPTRATNQLAPSMVKHPSCRLWQTPTQMDATPRSTRGIQTITTRSGTIRRKNKDNSTSNLGLVEQLRRLPAPQARDSSRATSPKRDRLPDVLGGIPNPPWIEWLMGWVISWTGIEPLATDKFRQWLEQHGICSRE